MSLPAAIALDGVSKVYDGPVVSDVFQDLVEGGADRREFRLSGRGLGG